MNDSKAIFSPSLLCANQLRLGETIEELDEIDIRWHHVDVMDGHFVPNMAFGLEAVAAICKAAKKPVYVHMMTEQPGRYVGAMAKAGAGVFAFHIEAAPNPFRLAADIRAAGMRCAAVLNPITPVALLEPLLPLLDAVTVMSVEPGYSGQSFLPASYAKIEALRKLANSANPALIIEVDGGVDDQNGAECLWRGANVLVAGVFTLFRVGGTLQENYRRSAKAIEQGGTGK